MRSIEVGLLAACIITAAPAAWSATVTSLAMQSQANDYIGGGRTWSYVSTSDKFSVYTALNELRININGADGSYWSLYFAPPYGQKWANGLYEYAVRELGTGLSPEVNVWGNGRGCNLVNGRFYVTDLKTDGQGNITAINLQFEQHCDTYNPDTALWGQFAFNTTGNFTRYVSIADTSFQKGNDGVTDSFMAVSLSHPSSSPVPVNISTVDGSGVAGRDYRKVDRKLVFPPFVTAIAVPVEIIGHRNGGTQKSFAAALSDPHGAKPGKPSATFSVLDPDIGVTAMAFNSTIDDGYLQPGPFLDSAATIPVVASAYSNDIAMSSDLGNAAALLMAPPGQRIGVGTYTGAQGVRGAPGVPYIIVSLLDIACGNPLGTFIVNKLQRGPNHILNKLSVDIFQDCEFASTPLYGWLRVNEPLQQVSIANAHMDGNAATFEVTINPPVQNDVGIFFLTFNGSAVAGTDFVGVSQRVVIPAGARSINVPVQLLETPHPGLEFYGFIWPDTTPAPWIYVATAHLK